MAEELPVDLRTWRAAAGPLPVAAPPRPRQPEASLPLRKRRSAMREAAAAAGGTGTPGPPPGKAPRGGGGAPGPACAPHALAPSCLALAFPPLPAAYYPGLLPAAGAGPPPPPPPLAFAPGPFALLGAAGTQLAADIAAATGQDEDGDTALHIAVAQGNLGAARRLVGLFLQGRRDLDVYNRLRQTPLHLAVITAQPALVKLLVAHGASPMAPDRHGRTGAHLACEHRSARCLRELLAAPGAPPDLEARNYEGLTPLHVAVGAGAREPAQLLLEAGADVDAADIKSGRSPLLHAVERGSLDMAQLLIQRGARVNAQSYAGCTALHAAAGRGLLALLRLLVRSGADCGLKNYHNDTALAVAKNRQVIDILRGKASRPPPAPPSPDVPPDTPRTPNGRTSASPESLPEAPSPPPTPGATATANQTPEAADLTNGVSTAGTRPLVKQEGDPALPTPRQPMGCAGGPALALPLADAQLERPQHSSLYPMASPGQEAVANPFSPLLPGPYHHPILSLGLGPLANQGPLGNDQSRTLQGRGSPAPGGPRLRPRDGRGQAGGGR
ncbi:B-cell lymphoma 3 protein isoform X2 [Rhea pennata]|uniref:B-cell lymphoma 3 protein isoform X2 n=1 Tax=Rhea pennata TaxID=8795 RepID=UPI002E274663